MEIGSLAVRESVYEGKFQSPKTQRAFRTIPLGPHAVKALVAHRDRVARQGPADLVFGNRKGGPLRESKVLTKVLQPAAVDAGLGRVTWHQLRHIHSSLLNDLNVPSKIAQEQLGHANFDHAGDLHARDSGVTSRCGRSGVRAIVRAIALECSRIREPACSRQARK